MKESIKTGISFGITSGIITTLGLIMGLYEGTGSKTAVIGGILTIAVADSMSDALGIHISEESENIHSSKAVWISTMSTFISKFIFASTFIIPIAIFDLEFAIIISIIWGLFLMTVTSYIIAIQNGSKTLHVIFEHLTVTILVIISTYYIGSLINNIIN